jgi:hypothetical protein
MESHCREIWTTKYLPRLPKSTSTILSDDSYTREVMGLEQDDEADEFSKYTRIPTRQQLEYP